MKSDEHLHEWISRYNEGTLKGDELERFRRILKSDPDVRLETNLDKELTEFLKDGELLAFLKVVDEVRYGRRRGNRIYYFLIAAVMLIFMTIGSFWIYNYTLEGFNRFPVAFSQGKDILDVEDTPSGSAFSHWTSPGYPGSQRIRDDIDKELLAANFTPLPYMEGLIGVAMRSTNVSLESPEFSIHIYSGDTVIFQWAGVGDATPSIEIIDNLGKKLWAFETLSGGEMKLGTSKWARGLYYWKFLAENDLVWVGKITVIEQEK